MKLWEWRIGCIVEMSVIGYNIICLTNKGTVNELVIIFVLYDDAKTEEGILPHDIP